ncbi:Teneurin-4 [Collichthys lucidus]|uniref:Teneurin-4 n=1 Tax=Collichthys lucidus TaxID=240159 RepID=A0A4U5UZM2_COLLU|nr:Teneurin-4 [Collichthys lucidus]
MGSVSAFASSAEITLFLGQPVLCLSSLFISRLTRVAAAASCSRPLKRKSEMTQADVALMKELIIQYKPSVCLYSALSVVNWQFSVVDICEIKQTRCYKEKLLSQSAGNYTPRSNPSPAPTDSSVPPEGPASGQDSGSAQDNWLLNSNIPLETRNIAKQTFLETLQDNLIEMDILASARHDATYNDGLKKPYKHCNWKCAALSAILISVTLLFLLAYFIVSYKIQDSAGFEIKNQLVAAHRRIEPFEINVSGGRGATKSSGVCFVLASAVWFGCRCRDTPMQRQMYQLSEDNTSGLPFPTDLSLPPLGNTGLEIPDRKGKDDSKLDSLFPDDSYIDMGEIDVGRKVAQQIPPGIFWRSQVFIDHPMYLKFNVSLSKDALVGIYGRRGLPPSHTQFDFVELLDGRRLLAQDVHGLEGPVAMQRSLVPITTHDTGFIQYMDSGIWHLAIYNDGKETETVSFLTTAIDSIDDCPSNCFGNGDCVSGTCHCFLGFKGPDCGRAGMVNTLKVAACVTAAGRAQSATFPPTSALTSHAAAMGRASWEPVSATRATKGKTAKKWIAWTQHAQAEGYVSRESATALWGGAGQDVRARGPPAWTSALDMELSWQTPEPAAVIPTGRAMTALQRFVQRTVVAMAFVCRAAAAVTTAGWALGVTRGRVTLAATNMVLARTANVNAVQRAVLVCAMEMVGALWVTMAGTVCASWAGGALAVTPPWKLPAVMSRTTMEATCHTTSLCVGSPDPLDIIQETQMSSAQSNLQTFYDRVHFLVGRDSTHIIPGASPFDGNCVTLFASHLLVDLSHLLAILYTPVNQQDVSVGFEYESCPDLILWEKRTAVLQGYETTASKLGGWTIDKHHALNIQSGILHMGNGENVFISQQPPVIGSVMGNGRRRSISCPSCNGLADGNKLLAPVALACGSDGSLYVGDFNYVRRIFTTGNVTSVLELSNSPAHKYYLATSPVNGAVYLSDTSSRKVFKVKSLNVVKDVAKNLELVAGTGDQCLPYDDTRCGDGGKAIEATLTNPRGITVDKYGVIFFVDGTMIRRIDQNGIISTLLGFNDLTSARPLSCDAVMDISQVRLEWPTDLAVSPMDNSLYVLDNNVVLQISENHQVRIVAGRPMHCQVPGIDHFLMSKVAIHATLESANALAVSHNGVLYIAESDEKKINRVRQVSTNGEISLVAGAPSGCDCKNDANCDCYSGDEGYAKDAKLNAPSSLAVCPDGELYIADLGNIRIRYVRRNKPYLNPLSMYEVSSPINDELYLFDSNGSHIFTQSLTTGDHLYNLTYTGSGDLSTITDKNKNTVIIRRDTTGLPLWLMVPDGQTFWFTIGTNNALKTVGAQGQELAVMTYHGSSGLLATKTNENGWTTFFEYDSYGRLTNVTYPTGRVSSYRTDADSSVRIQTEGSNKEEITVTTNLSASGTFYTLMQGGGKCNKSAGEGHINDRAVEERSHTKSKETAACVLLISLPGIHEIRPCVLAANKVLVEQKGTR